MLQYNKCPAVAPVSVLDNASQQRIGIDVAMAEKHKVKLLDNTEFISKLSAALGIIEDKQATLFESEDVDTKLYDSFWNNQDKHMLNEVLTHPPATLGELLPKMSDKRMHKLLPLYKARNYPAFLSPE